MIEEESAEFRRAVASCERTGSGHLPEELRTRGVKLARQIVESGQGIAAVCRALGVSSPTAKLWSRGAQPNGRVSMAMVPVDVVAARATPSAKSKAAERRVSVTSAGGYRVDDLTMAEAAALLRALR